MDRTALVLLALAHCLIDSFAMTLVPLWPDIQRRLGLSDAGVQIQYALWGGASSMSQALFGYLADSRPSRWMIGFGLSATIICLSLIGYAPSAVALGVLLVVGGLGAGAFHPEAAALVGAASTANRSRGMSIFVIGGMMGLAIGPIYSGRLTDAYGLEALLWSLPVGLLLAAGFTISLGRLPEPARRHERGKSASLGEVLAGRGKAVALVLAISTLRVIPAVGILQALAFTLKARGETNATIGLAQATFQLANAAGAFGCALLARRISERQMLWILPALAAGPIAALGVVPYSGILALLTLAGLALGGAGPALISYGQQLLPGGQRIASSLTMGVSWGLGGGVVAVLMGSLNAAGVPHWAFLAFAPATLFSSFLCAALPVAQSETITLSPVSTGAECAASGEAELSPEPAEPLATAAR